MSMNHIHVATLYEPWASLQLDERWLQSMMTKAKAEDDARRESRATTTAITNGRVPRSICKADPEAYEPRFVSLGPYHRGKPHLKSMEELKWHYLRDFLSRNRCRSLDEYLKRLTSVADRARCAYSEYYDDPAMETNEFVEMLLLDGCFIVELFLKRRADDDGGHGRKYEDPIPDTKWALTLVMVDMLMFENQLPFFVLEMLYDTVSASAAPEPFANLALRCLELAGGFQMNTEFLSRGKVQTFHHLLHLFYSSVLPFPAEEEAAACTDTEEKEEDPCAKSCLLSELCRRCSSALQLHNPLREHQDSILCATKLKEAGIKFRSKQGAASFQDITFGNGWFEIPQIRVFGFTKYLLRNMIAFEQCNRHVGDRVATYAALMDCIVDTPEDVALLQKEGVIENCLGDDAAVAVLFNGLCKGVSAQLEGTYLSDVVEKVNEHSNSKMNKWTFKLYNSHFKTPWSILSLVAFIALLLLTALQTIFTILPYVNPRN